MRLIFITFLLLNSLAQPNAHQPNTSRAPDCSQVDDLVISECSALSTLYSSTHGDQWDTFFNWSSPHACQNWQGIYCVNQHIHILSLSGAGLVGSLPDMSALSQLQTINLGYNPLLRNVLAGLATLSQLQDLNIEHNDDDENLSSLSSLTNLQELLLNDNQLHGSLAALDNLNQLGRLYLQNNQLSGNILDLNRLSQLQIVDLDNNQFSGGLPDLSNLDQLFAFSAADNHLSGPIPGFSNLQELILSNNQLSGGLPDFSSTLHFLNVAQNQLSGVIPDSILSAHLGSNYWVGPDFLVLCGGNNVLNSTNPTVNHFISTLDTTWHNGCRSYTTDQQDTIGVYRNGVFYLRNHNNNGYADLNITFGGAGLLPIVGDWTGTNIDCVGVYDPTISLFSLRNSNTDGPISYQFVFGIPNDQPLAGHWSSSAPHSGIGIFRPSNGLIFLRNELSSGYAEITIVLGIPGDIGLSGDWNGDGIDSPGVYRPLNQHFYLSDTVTSGPIFGDYDIQFGLAGDQPLSGDWTGSGHSGIGIFRPSDGQIYLKNDPVNGASDTAFTFGITQDIPVSGHWSIPTMNSLGQLPDLLIPNATEAPLPPARQPGQNYDG